MSMCKSCNRKNHRRNALCMFCGTEMRSRKKTPAEKQKIYFWIEIVFGVILLFAAGFFIISAISFYSNADSTTATITHRIRGERFQQGWIYFTYEVDGIAHEGITSSLNNIGGLRSVGREFRVFFNPENPSEYGDLFNIGYPIILILFGGGGVSLIRGVLRCRK